MTTRVLKSLAIFALASVLPVAGACAAPEGENIDHGHLLGNRTLLGTVDEVRSDQARVNTGEGQPRFVPMNVRKDKGLPDLHIGDQVEITVNDQNLLFQYRQDGFFPLPGDHAEFDLAGPDEEHGICRISLRKDGLVLRDRQIGFAATDFGEEGVWDGMVEWVYVPKYPSFNRET